MAQVTSSQTVHDVVIIGSGAGGGTATKVLADLGISVLLLEAGPMLNMADLKEHMWPFQFPHRGAGARGQAYTGGPTGFTYSATYGGNQLEGEPYTVAPGSDFSWFRSRILGGRTNHYGRVTLRFADYDFKPRSTDGLGFDWPISLRRSGAVLRQGGAADRRHRDGRGNPQRARRHLQSAGSAEGARRARAARVRETGHSRRRRPSGGHDGGARRPAALPLLRTMRTRLPDRVELRVELRPDLPGDEDRKGAGHRERHGARADHRRHRQGHRGLVHRQDDRQRAAGAVPHGRARRERVRVGAPAAQFQVSASPRRPRELVGRRRQIPDGHRRLQHVGEGPCALGHAATTTPTATGRISMCRGGDGRSRRSSGSLAGTTSKSAAATACRASARSRERSADPKGTA